MTPTDVHLLWLYVAETWPTFTIPTEPELVGIKEQAWFDQLGDLEPSQVRAALASLGASEFAPPLGKIREKALQLATAAPPAPDLDLAWRQAITTFGTDPNLHPAVLAACKAIGEYELRYCENQVALRAHFFRAYEAAKERHERDALLPPPAVLAYVSARGAIKRADDVLELDR